MWRKKKWIIVAVAAGVLILTLGALGVAAYAQTSTPLTQPNASKTIIGRVSTILGIDQAKVQAAFDQAQKDQQNEAEAARLNALVSQGKLTQAQADSYKAWLQSKPNLPAGLGLPNGTGNAPMMGPRGHMGFRGFPGQPGAPKPPVPGVSPALPAPLPTN